MLRIASLCVFVVLVFASAPSQELSAKDAQALLLIEETLAASGWVDGVTQFQDFEATGSITYYWAGEEVTGSVVIKGKGTEEFRLDAALPDGQRSFRSFQWRRRTCGSGWK